MSNLDRGPGLSVLLGTEYERKKQKLQEELQLDYKRYIDQKRDLKAEPYSRSQPCLSLPIDERTTVKEKLREERNREYNLFLQEQANARRFRQKEPSFTPKTEEAQALDIAYRSPPAHPAPTSHPEPPSSRRDAATLTDTTDNKKGRKTWNMGHQKQRPLLSRRQESYDSSEDNFNTDSEEEFESSHRRRPKGRTHKSKYRKKKEHRAKRALLDGTYADAAFPDENNNNQNQNSEALHLQDNRKMDARARPTKENPVFATGLLIGQIEEQEASQMKKEQYKQALLKQIAEQQENKRKEKLLELKVAATGVTDPHKGPDRFRQFGAVSHNYDKWKQGVFYKPEDKDNSELNAVSDSNGRTEQRQPPPGRTKVSFPSPSLDYSSALNHVQRRTGRETAGTHKVPLREDDYHRDLSHMIGEVATKRVSDVLPPLTPRVGSTYKTPYDGAYYYYGSRHPVDPMLSSYQKDAKGPQATKIFQNPPQRRAILRPPGPSQADYGQRIPVIPDRKLSAERTKQRLESAMSYQEALNKQIEDIEERRRREKEERERYDAKKEAERMTYNPWGRSGGGAPIKDQQGNLITNLDQMHKTNEKTIRNPLHRFNILTHSFGSSEGGTPRSPHRPLVLNDEPELPQRQDTYKEALKQQIEENRRKKEEEKERLRIAEEKEEKRLAEERARILKEYEEEEQRNRNKFQHRVDHQTWAYEHNKHYREGDKNEKTTPDKGQKRPEINKEQGSQQTRQTQSKTRQELREQSVPSPPITTLRHQQTDTKASRPPSAGSQRSSKTERSVSAQVPVQQQQQQDGQQEVTTTFSALRRYLRKQQQQLEGKLMRTDSMDEHQLPLTRRQRQAKGDTAELLRKENVLPPTEKRHSAQVNMRSIREFNRLKYRDTSSREEVLHEYPDPPTDAQSLDIQQQALLREQQRRLRLMKRKESGGYLDQLEGLPLSMNKSERHARNSILPSETAFLDVYSGDEDFLYQPSADLRQKSSHRRRHNGEAVSVDQMDDSQPDAQSLSSDTNVNLAAQSRHGRRHKYPSESQSGDEVDLSSLHSTLSALERGVSVETVATEPWLRPGTSEAEHLDYRRPSRRPQARP